MPIFYSILYAVLGAHLLRNWGRVQLWGCVDELGLTRGCVHGVEGMLMWGLLLGILWALVCWHCLLYLHTCDIHTVLLSRLCHTDHSIDIYFLHFLQFSLQQLPPILFIAFLLLLLLALLILILPDPIFVQHLFLHRIPIHPLFLRFGPVFIQNIQAIQIIIIKLLLLCVLATDIRIGEYGYILMWA